MLEISDCPYCENELYIWQNYNLCKCETESCNFGERTVDELVRIIESDFEEEHAATIELMTSYDGGLK